MKRTIENSVLAVAAVLMLTGCQSNAGNSAETEALKEQIARLEQQISDLEQRQSASDANIGGSARSQEDRSAADSQMQESDTSDGTSHQSHRSAADSGNAATGLTTYTMEELSALVEDFTAKAGAAVPGGNGAQDMELFFALKQEEKQIDDALDYHEDELEYLYKKGSLTREEYKKQERELELLEDKLDDMEDQLEYRFGIDD